MKKAKKHLVQLTRWLLVTIIAVIFITCFVTSAFAEKPTITVSIVGPVNDYNKITPSAETKVTRFIEKDSSECEENEQLWYLIVDGGGYTFLQQHCYPHNLLLLDGCVPIRFDASDDENAQNWATRLLNMSIDFPVCLFASNSNSQNANITRKVITYIQSLENNLDSPMKVSRKHASGETIVYSVTNRNGDVGLISIKIFDLSLEGAFTRIVNSYLPNEISIDSEDETEFYRIGLIGLNDKEYLKAQKQIYNSTENAIVYAPVDLFSDEYYFPWIFVANTDYITELNLQNKLIKNTFWVDSMVVPLGISRYNYVSSWANFLIDLAQNNCNVHVYASNESNFNAETNRLAIQYIDDLSHDPNSNVIKFAENMYFVSRQDGTYGLLAAYSCDSSYSETLDFATTQMCGILDSK